MFNCLECSKCPYHLGYIKCIVNPCINCKRKYSKTILRVITRKLKTNKLKRRK